jgi:hypothetical protein
MHQQTICVPRALNAAGRWPWYIRHLCHISHYDGDIPSGCWKICRDMWGILTAPLMFSTFSSLLFHFVTVFTYTYIFVQIHSNNNIIWLLVETVLKTWEPPCKTFNFIQIRERLCFSYDVKFHLWCSSSTCTCVVKVITSDERRKRNGKAWNAKWQKIPLEMYRALDFAFATSNSKNKYVYNNYFNFLLLFSAED